MLSKNVSFMKMSLQVFGSHQNCNLSQFLDIHGDNFHGGPKTFGFMEN